MKRCTWSSFHRVYLMCIVRRRDGFIRDVGATAVLFTKVVLALISGRSADPFLDAQREKHLAVMRQLTAAKRTASSAPDVLLVDYQLFHIAADLRWMEHAAGKLAALARDTRS